MASNSKNCNEDSLTALLISATSDAAQTNHTASCAASDHSSVLADAASDTTIGAQTAATDAGGHAEDVISNWVELGELWKLTWPSAITSLCRLGMSLTDLAMVGHLGTDELAAASLSLVWMNITSVYVYRGFGTAIITLCSRAFGARSYHLVGIWLQLGVLFTSIMVVPVAVAWWFTADVARLVGVSDSISSMAGDFARWSLLGMWSLLIYSAMNNYFQAQGLVVPALFVNILFLGLNLALNFVFIYGAFGWSGLGFIGSPIATAVSRAGQILTYYLYAIVWKRQHERTWGGWSTECLRRDRLKIFVNLSVSLIIAGCLEEWQLELITFFASRLGEVEVATHNAIVYVFMFVSSVLMGIATATNIRVGFFLGSGKPKSAKQVDVLALTRMALPSGLVIGGIIMGIRYDIGKVFSSDERVWDQAATIAWFVGGGYALMSLYYTSMATLEAQGRATLCAISFFIGSWVISAPLAWVFGFTLHMDLLGIWIGLITGYTFMTVFTAIAVFRSDWSALATLAMLTAEAKHLLPQSEDGAIASGNAGTLSMAEELLQHVSDPFPTEPLSPNRPQIRDTS